MKQIHIITFLLLTFLPFQGLSAQDEDSLKVQNVLTYDKMMEELSDAVTAPAYLNNAMQSHIDRNASRKNMCWRIRIFFNNSQDSRTASSEIVKSFSEQFPSVPVYNQYVNPFFKVTVGDFRSKSDAMRFMTEIKPSYPSAFLVREAFVIYSDRN
ncbi:MAG: SPOR domain-containing protein [Alistipes sp.]|nr:SPOR domain-containing protein [Candidatus Minthomonas equi]